MDSTDVFVIGGGPAGLAAAIAVRQRGFRVTVADGAHPPIDKTCGEGLMPDGLASLERLGVRLPAYEGFAFTGIRFLSESFSADAGFPQGSGIAVRRTTLHRILTEHAERAGADLLWNTVVTGIARDRVQIGDREIRTKWIIGADGRNSRVRRWAALDRGPSAQVRYAFRRHYRVAPWTDRMEVYWGEHCQGYATAVNRDEVCVALASHDPHLRLEEGLSKLPTLSARLRGAEAVTTERGALTGNRRHRRVWRNHVALIGDASGGVDAITGEGLGLSFRQALALAKCLESRNLARYQQEHRRLVLRPLFMARLMLTLDGRPQLQQRTLSVFRTHPHVFRSLLALHLGQVSLAHLAWGGLTLGWGLLTA